jgi:hypothetical protein
MPRRLTVRSSVVMALAVVPLGVAACGDDDSKTSDKAPAKAVATALAITTSDATGKRFTTDAPTTIKGGLVELTFTNSGKGSHEAQLVRVDAGHTAKEAIDVVATEKPGIPAWFHAAGGAGSTAPGETVKTTMNLPAGKYVMVDNDQQDGPPQSTRGALAEFEVTAGDDGALPASTATITAATDESAKPEHSFDVTGLKVGKNRLRLVDKGEQVHHAIMFPIAQGKTIADVKKFFTTQGQPSGPPPIDFENGAGTAALDGDTEQVTDLVLRKAGTYAVVCFLTDKDGKDPKPHLASGMLTEVEVK